MRTLLFVIVGMMLLGASETKPATIEDQKREISRRISTGPFARLYSNTFYDLLGRIEEDGFMRESNDPLKGYDGMYPRTVGGTVSLLLAADRPEPAERLIRCVLNATTYNGMDRIPHAFDKRRNGSPGIAGRYVILGRGDQLDGQAHLIMAWARLANYRGRTAFEDSTYTVVAELLNSSFRPPYCQDTTAGKIPQLMFNPYLEHSRPVSVQWGYDLLTQFFVGAAASEMISVARRRNDSLNARSWKHRLQILEEAIAEHFIVRRDGKQTFVELLLRDSNRVFDGLGWLVMAPIASQWNPFGNAVMRNTVDYMYAHLSRRWEGVEWMPTDSWPDGSFTPSIIGKGVAWELEFASREKRYRRISQLIDIVEYLHRDSTIYMESAYLYNGDAGSVPVIGPDDLTRYRQAIWKLTDPGNGEQISWWCWSVANLRKRLGLSAVPERVTPAAIPDPERLAIHELAFREEPGLSIYYTVDGTIPSERSARYAGRMAFSPPVRVNVVAKRDGMLASGVASFDLLRPENGLEYRLSAWEKDGSAAADAPVPVRTGTVKSIEIPMLPEVGTRNVLAFEGFLKIETKGEYAFRVRSFDHADLAIDGRSVATTDDPPGVTKIRLEKGFHSFLCEMKNLNGKSRMEVSLSRNGSKFAAIPPGMLFQSAKAGAFVEMPEILPVQSAFDPDRALTMEIRCPTKGATVHYTLDGTDATVASELYVGPVTVSRSAVVKASAFDGAGNRSSQAVMRYLQMSPEVSISLTYAPNPRYAGQGGRTLIDGIKGSLDPVPGQWLGFHGTDFEAVLDFRKSREINEVMIGFMHNPESWIFLPKKVRLSVSQDGAGYDEVAALDVNPAEIEKPEIRRLALLSSPVQCRFVKIRAENFGVCPPWHKAAGNDSWVFVDEIEIR